MDGQISLYEWLTDYTPTDGCRCMCRECLYWWSDRCPYGSCYDDERARRNPYDRAHPEKPPRTWWTNWKTDQAYWCRGGVMYPAKYCQHFVRYEGQVVKNCLECNVSVFQDGYILCSIVDTVGCGECYRRFEERRERHEKTDLER